MEFRSIFKNSVFYTFANALQGMIGFFLLPIYTKYLSPSDYATLALVTAFIGIVSTIITFQIHSGIPRFVIKFSNNIARAKAYFTSIFLLFILVLLIGCSVINFFGESIIQLVFSSHNKIAYAPFFQIAVWIILPNLLTSTCLSLLQTLEKGFNFFLATAIQVTITVCCSLYFVVSLKMGILGILLGQLIGNSAALIIVIFVIRGWFKFSFSGLNIKDITDSLRYSVPIIPHVLSIYIYMYSDRLILQRYVPLSDIGIYSIADTFAGVLLLIVNATTAAYSPRFLKLAEEDKAKAQETTKKFIEIWWVGIMIILMGYFILSSYVVRLMTRPSFYPSIPFIPILAIAYVFRGLYCFATNGIFYVEKTKVMPIITITAALLNIILNLLFIPRFGIYAAAWNTVISYFITFILAYYFSEKYYSIKFPWLNMARVSLLFGIVYIITLVFDKVVTGSLLFKFSFHCAVLIFFGAAIFLLKDKGIPGFIKTRYTNI